MPNDVDNSRLGARQGDATVINLTAYREAKQTAATQSANAPAMPAAKLGGFTLFILFLLFIAFLSIRR